MDDDWNQPESDRHRANNMATFIHPGVNSIFSQPKVAVLKGVAQPYLSLWDSF